MKQILGLFLILILLILAVPLGQYYLLKQPVSLFSSPKPKASVTINNHTFGLTFATTEEEKSIGLSQHTSLPQDQGMLFSFDTPSFYSFWMKNMQFPIDIIFIKDNKVVTVFPNAQPAQAGDENPPTFTPEEPADTVLEINAGLSEMYGIKKGDVITISRPQ